MGKEVREEKKKITKSSRLLIRSKKLRTSSSDERPPRKMRSKGQITMRKAFERLRQSGKYMTGTDEPRQSHVLSEQLNISKNCDMTAKASIENS